MPNLSQLRPCKKERVIDCLKQAGIRIPKDKNRFFLSQCAFRQDEKIVVLNLWFETQIKQLGGNIVIKLELPAMGEKTPYRPKSVRDAIKLAKDKSLKVRIIVLDGKMRGKNSKVSKRCLDPMPWSVKSYNEKTGKCLLVRDVSAEDGPTIKDLNNISRLSDARRGQENTFLFVSDPKYGPERVRSNEHHSWSCSSKAKVGDHAFVYVKGIGICYEWRILSNAQPKINKPWPYGCEVEYVSDFDPPIAVKDLCLAISKKEWNAPYVNMRVKTSIIPPKVVNKINSLRAKIRLPVVHDRLQQNAFEILRTWRQSHPTGLLLCVNGKQALWHNASCKHIGDPNANYGQWEISLTKRRKILGGTIEDLKRWASENGLNARSCSDCKNDPFTEVSIAEGFKLLDEAELIATTKEYPTGPSPRIATMTQRIVRDTELAKSVKERHGYHCQICGVRIPLPDGRFYAEAHHIRPLGSPDDGPDSIDNILCLCPNHHVELDYGCVRIDKAKIQKCDSHSISDAHISYHNVHRYTGNI